MAYFKLKHVGEHKLYNSATYNIVCQKHAVGIIYNNCKSRAQNMYNIEGSKV